MNYISSNIKFLRQNNNLTQEQLAAIVNKSRVLVSQWESDARGIATEDIIKLSDFFNVPMDKFVGKDLRIAENKEYDEFEIYFDKNKNVLKDSDKAIIRVIVEERKKEIDEELGDDVK